MAEFTDCIRSVIPGRLRLRHPALKTLDAETLEFAKGCLFQIDGVYAVNVNEREGSLLIEWDRDVLSVDDMIETLMGYAQMLVGAGFEDEADSKEASTTCKVMKTVSYGADQVMKTASRVIGKGAVAITSQKPHSDKFVVRQATSRVMFSALSISMLAIMVSGGKGLHVLAGTAFLGFLGFHMLQNRRLL